MRPTEQNTRGRGRGRGRGREVLTCREDAAPIVQHRSQVLMCQYVFPTVQSLLHTLKHVPQPVRAHTDIHHEYIQPTLHMHIVRKRTNSYTITECHINVHVAVVGGSCAKGGSLI